MFNYSFTKVSGNSKTGPIPVTMSEMKTCPDACAFKSNGCYAEAGMVRMHWQRLTIKGLSFDTLIDNISALPKRTFWRHNIAGDLPNVHGKILGPELGKLVQANLGKQGFTYTHCDPTFGANFLLINHANAHGFTINLSANSLDHADELADMNIGPVVCVLPIDAPKLSYTPKGRAIVVCPAVTVDSMDCNQCRLCAKVDRKSIVGFPAHGTGKNKIQRVINIQKV